MNSRDLFLKEFLYIRPGEKIQKIHFINRKAVDCVKALRTADLRGRGGQISTRNKQDSGCAVACKKSHNQKGYIGINQNAFKHLINKPFGDCCNRFQNLKSILISHNKPP